LNNIATVRAFRFGFQFTNDDPDEVVRSARAAEGAGFDVFHTGDHVNAKPSTFASLAAASTGTTRIRVCPLVLNNDLRHPVVLAQELSSIDRLSEGQLEVGIGAGHSFTEYAAIGKQFDPPVLRKVRLAEAVEILRALLDGERVSYSGDHYHLEDVSIVRPAQDHVPILVGVNGKSALAHAADNADIIGLTMLGRTLPGGQHHEARWEPERLNATIAWIRDRAGERWPLLELQALIQAVVITDDRPGVAEQMAGSTRTAGRGRAHDTIPRSRHQGRDCRPSPCVPRAVGDLVLQRAGYRRFCPHHRIATSLR